MRLRGVRTRFLWILIGLIPLLSVLPLAAPHGAAALAALPQGFTDTEFATGFGGRLTTMTFAPDGRLFVSEKQGAVRIVKNGVLKPAAFLTVVAATDNEKGLKGIAFDPAYATDPQRRFVYVYYTDAVTLKNKISRFTTNANDPDVADPNSETVLIDGIDSGIFHSAGALHFGADGKLYISTGDASYAPNAQNLNTLEGKILRINSDGTVPADNPFVGQANRRPEIWAYGLRNPFTFAFSNGGQLFINEVGNSTWEELDVGAKGANYGWPTCEGICNDPRFVDPIYEYNHADGPGKSITGATFYEASMFPSGYAGDYFFGDYVGNYIKRYDVATGQVSDFATNAMNPVDLDVGPDGALYYLSVEAKKVNRIAYGEAPPPPPSDGNVFQNPGFESTGAGWLSPWRSTIRSPAAATLARDTGNPPVGAASLRVDISAASQDWYVQVMQPNVPLAAGRVYTFAFWAKASSSRTIRPAFQRNSAPYPVYFQQGFGITSQWQRYTARFTPAADDPRALFSFNLGADTGQVWIDDVSLIPSSAATGQPPAVTLTAPAAGTRYKAGDQITFSGSATDPEDGDLPAAMLTWEIVFHHDTHTHPYIEPFSGVTSGTFTIPDTGEASANSWYRVHLTATDSAGNSTEDTRDVTPLTQTVTLDTTPGGLGLSLDGSPATAPLTFVGVVNFQREISAAPSQAVGGTTYQFQGWSDAGAATHMIRIPAARTTYLATYQAPSDPNLFQNGGFETNGTGWLNPWRANIRSPARATLVRDTTGQATGAAALRVDITTASADWYVQVLQPNISLTAGAPHTLTFRARSSTNSTLRLAFQQNGGSYPVYFQQSFAVTTVWQQFSVTFTPGTTDPRALFAFNIGATAGQVWLDDVSLTR